MFFHTNPFSLTYRACLRNKSCFLYYKNERQIFNYIRNFCKEAENPLFTRVISRNLVKRNFSMSSVHFISSAYILNLEQRSQTNPSLTDQILSAKEKPNIKIEDDAEKKKDQQNKARAIKFSFIALMSIMGICGICLVIVYGKPHVDESGREYKDIYSEMALPKQYIMRAINEAKIFKKVIEEPTRELLLPDPLKEPYIQPPFTLVFEMKDVLVHPEWTYKNGWRFKKRPGVDFLLQHCAPPLFEIVIYTNEQGFTAYPVIEQLDVNGFIWYKLFKDSTRYVEGKHLKDLTCLNRDLKKVVMVDWDKDAVTAHRNQLCLKRWKGSMDDQTLVDLALMLRAIAESEVDDVREVLDYYKKFDDPISAFRENQRAAQEQELERRKKVEEATSRQSYLSGLSSSFLRRR